LSGTLLIYDGLHFQNQIISFQKSEKQIAIGLKSGFEILRNKIISEVIDFEVFKTKIDDKNYQLIDIREVYEEPKIEGSNVANIPLDNLENFLLNIEKTKKVILFCNTGQQSHSAMNYFKKEGFENIFHLQNGIQHRL